MAHMHCICPINTQDLLSPFTHHSLCVLIVIRNQRGSWCQCPLIKQVHRGAAIFTPVPIFYLLRQPALQEVRNRYNIVNCCFPLSNQEKHHGYYRQPHNLINLSVYQPSGQGIGLKQDTGTKSTHTQLFFQQHYFTSHISNRKE